ncbi:hypothetical protein [Frankia gtarii]|uniref:hypothetical protein n=1 Tax=Frankia gtarii TaxID=2950102 RepID=UPI0021C0269C|nr:hypothetical protein [Frankia gtarii]
MAVPRQGVQATIDLFGRREQVYFYNTFLARHPSSRLAGGPGIGEIEVARDGATGDVHALRGPTFASVQFHAASVLTRNGLAVMDDLVTGALRGRHSSPRVSCLGDAEQPSQPVYLPLGWTSPALLSSAARSVVG